MRAYQFVEKRKPPRLPRRDSRGGQAKRQMRQEHFKWLIRAGFNDPLGILGVMAVRISV
jgi:hypothetical protein